MQNINGIINKISATVKEGPANYIIIDEVAAALKKMKRQSPRNDTIHRVIGTQWILDLRNGIVKVGCIPEDWKSSVGRESRSSGVWIYTGVKLLEHASTPSLKKLSNWVMVCTSTPSLNFLQVLFLMPNTTVSKH